MLKLIENLMVSYFDKLTRQYICLNDPIMQI